MKKKLLTVIGTLVAVAAITATTALALGGNYRIVNSTEPEVPAVTEDRKVIEGGHVKSFGFGMNIDVPVTEEQRAEALRQIKAQLDQQVADGRITSEQADKLYAAAEKSEFGVSVKMEPGVLGELFGEPFMHREKFEMTEEMQEEMLAKTKEHLDAAVAAGKITQEQADEMYEKMKNGERFNFRIKGEKSKDGEPKFDIQFGEDELSFDFNSFDMPPMPMPDLFSSGDIY